MHFHGFLPAHDFGVLFETVWLFGVGRVNYLEQTNFWDRLTILQVLGHKQVKLGTGI